MLGGSRSKIYIYAVVVIFKAFNHFNLLNRPQILNFNNECHNFDGGYDLKPNCPNF